MSKISDLNDFYVQQAYVNKPAAKTEGEPPAPVSAQPPKEDTVSISPQSRNMLIAMKEAESLPSEEEWEQRVQKLQEEIRAGNYQVNGEKIADKMIGGIVNRFA